MTTTLSTKIKMLSALEDIEVLSKTLFEALACKQAEDLNCAGVVDQLLAKEQELLELQQQAANQQRFQKKIDQLRAEIAHRDQELVHYQRQLKEADRLLSLALYYSKQKLQTMEVARQHPVDSEELIRFAHKISSSNGVMSPFGWAPGDPRRPYPTLAEMRNGFLGFISENGQFSADIQDAVAVSTNDKQQSTGGVATVGDNSYSGGGPSGAVMGSFTSGPVQSRTEDVDTMSTDSSSSSSSDE